MKIAEILKHFGDQKLLVIGDLMLDRYIFGAVDRISPEAPVAVLKVREESETPGGAANVALNLKSLGAAVELVGSAGKDAEGDQLMETLRRSGIGTDGVVRDKSKPTTTKTRLIAGNQQIARIDKEVNTEISGSSENSILRNVASSLKRFKPKGIIISDYAKGTVTDRIVTETIKLAKQSGVFVTVDPKGNHYTRYRGANVVTPNQKEAESAAGITISDEDTLHQAGRKLLDETKADFILVTLGKEGISYFSEHGEEGTIPSLSAEVFDVTGAGDTVVSVFTLAFLSSYLLEESLRIANAAAGLVVSRIGAASLTREDLSGHFARAAAKQKSKIYERDPLSKTLSDLRARGKKIVFTNGCFDLFHAGHLKLLTEARKLGDALVVAINSDDSVKRLKGGGRPYISEDDRASLLTALDCVDYLVVFEEDTPLNLIKKLRPAIIVKGGDYKPRKVVGKKFVESYGGSVKIIPLVEGISTSSLPEKIKNSK